MYTIGYAHAMNKSWGLRADYTSVPTVYSTDDIEGMRMRSAITSRATGAYVDWFPFRGGFHMSLGAVFNDTKANLNYAGGNSATFNGQPVDMTGKTYSMMFSFPSTAPYIGIGYGHQKAKRGVDFYFELGAIFGKYQLESYKTNLTTTYSGFFIAPDTTQAGIDAQNQAMTDNLNKLGYIPVAAIGLVYRF